MIACSLIKMFAMIYRRSFMPMIAPARWSCQNPCSPTVFLEASASICSKTDTVSFLDLVSWAASHIIMEWFVVCKQRIFVVWCTALMNYNCPFYNFPFCVFSSHARTSSVERCGYYVVNKTIEGYTRTRTHTSIQVALARIVSKAKYTQSLSQNPNCA